ncbi:MAG: hypothetical protein KUG77_06080, partial [Nannocystaceae bacterium]|nr:hypothetical protein [Nannocystaceae bacterium]
MTSNLKGWNNGNHGTFRADNELGAGTPLYGSIAAYADAFPGGYTAMRSEPARMLRAGSWSEMFSA